MQIWSETCTYLLWRHSSVTWHDPVFLLTRSFLSKVAQRIPHSLKALFSKSLRGLHRSPLPGRGLSFHRSGGPRHDLTYRRGLKAFCRWDPLLTVNPPGSCQISMGCAVFRGRSFLFSCGGWSPLNLVWSPRNFDGKLGEIRKKCISQDFNGTLNISFASQPPQLFWWNWTTHCRVCPRLDPSAPN